MLALAGQSGTMHGAPTAPPEAVAELVPPSPAPQPAVVAAPAAPAEVIAAQVTPAAPTSPAEPAPAAARRKPSKAPATKPLLGPSGLPPMVLRVDESYRPQLSEVKRLLRLAGHNATNINIIEAALDYYLPLVRQHHHLVPPRKG